MNSKEQFTLTQRKENRKRHKAMNRQESSLYLNNSPWTADINIQKDYQKK